MGGGGCLGPSRGLALNLQQLKKELNPHPPHPAGPPQGPVTPIHSLDAHHTSVSSEGQRGLSHFIYEEMGPERGS